MTIERGDILLVEFDPTRGSEIQKTRPAVVVTNDVANTYARILVIVPLTSQNLDKVFVHEVLLNKAVGLKKPSKANIAQMRAIDRQRIKLKVGEISNHDLRKIDAVLKLHLGLA